jgi:hypothetical protein
MQGVIASIHLSPTLGLVGVLILWIVLFEASHVLIALLRQDRLIGWAIGPLGVTTLFVREPSRPYIVIKALIPALVSGSALYIGLFTRWSPLMLPRSPLLVIPILVVGVLLTSAADFLNALSDLLFPLWGEARILRSMQILRASWATIHFTSFGQSYIRDHFNATPNDLMQAF